MASGVGGSKAGAVGGTDAPVARGPGGKNPAQRAAEHADKKRQFDSRRAATPGPGSYSPARPAQVHGGSKKGSIGNSASFASKTKRIGQEKMDEGGDPGSYDPYILKELAITSKKSASKAMKAGSGSFGVKQQRRMQVDYMGEGTPGPGAYNGDAMMRSGKKANLAAFDTGERMPSSAFKSKTEQRVKAKNLGVPGAGAYSPQWTAIEKQQRNPANGMKGKGERFKGANTWERAQATEPGPGSYEIEYLRTGGKSSVATATGSASKSKEIAFSSDALRELPWEVS
jgi:hypothetical protein